MTIDTIVNQLGRSIMIQRLNLDTRSISLAKSRGVFPASWYAVVQDLAREKGIEVPDRFFNFKAVAKPQSASPEGV